METKSDVNIIEVDGQKVYTELATIIIEGKDFTNVGGFYDGNYAVGYLGKSVDGGFSINDWMGAHLGNAYVIHSWKTPRSFVSSEYFQVEAIISGVIYTGRCAGLSMLWKGKRKSKQKLGPISWDVRMRGLNDTNIKI